MSSTTSEYYHKLHGTSFTTRLGSTSGLSEASKTYTVNTTTSTYTGVTRGFTSDATLQHDGTTSSYSVISGTGSFGRTSDSGSQSTSAETFETTQISTSSGTPTIQTNVNYYDSVSTGAEFTTAVCSTRTVTTSSTDQASTEQYHAAYTYTASRYNYNTASNIENTQQVEVANSTTQTITKTEGVYYGKTTIRFNTDDVIVYTVPRGFGAVPSIYPASAVLQGTVSSSVFGGPRNATIFGSVTTSQATSDETKTNTLTKTSLSSFTYETNSQTSTHTAGSVSTTYTNSYTEPTTYVSSADTSVYTTKYTNSSGITASTQIGNKGTSFTEVGDSTFTRQTSKTSGGTADIATYSATAGVCNIVYSGINVTVMTPNLPDGFIGFGFSTNAQNLAVYKTISADTSGSSFANIQTSDITSDLSIKKIGSYGGKLIVTGKCGLPANNSSRSLSWSTNTNTPDFSTASTLEATHASTYTETYTNSDETVTSTLTSTAGMSFLFSCVSNITDKDDFVSIYKLESSKKYFQTYYASIGHHDALTKDRTLVFMPGDYTFHKTINGSPSEVTSHISDLWLTSIMPDSENWLIEKQDVYRCRTVNALDQQVIQYTRFYNDWSYNWPP